MDCRHNLRALHTFETVSRHMSVAAAARELGGKRLADHVRLEVPGHESFDIMRGPLVGYSN